MTRYTVEPYAESEVIYDNLQHKIVHVQYFRGNRDIEKLCDALNATWEGLHHDPHDNHSAA